MKKSESKGDASAFTRVSARRARLGGAYGAAWAVAESEGGQSGDQEKMSRDYTPL